MSFLISFFQNVFGSYWERLIEGLLKLIMGPVVFFLFGPIFKISNKIANYILSKVMPNLNDIGLTADSLMGWFVDCFRLVDCASSLMTFLVMGFTISIIKMVF